MILIVASKNDPASMNIAQQILEHYNFEKLSETFHQNHIYLKKIRDNEVRLLFVKGELVDTQYLTDFFAPQLIVFASRHSSVKAIPTLSVHTPGNLAEAKTGGITRKVSISPASAMKDALLEMTKMKEALKLNYEVSYECTHHGPSLDVPAMFVELGSSPTQWKDQKAAEAVAHAAMTAIAEGSAYPAALGLGGPHYNAKFTKRALTTATAFGHIIPKYAVSQVDAEILKQCVDRTVEKVESAVLDWKGIKGEFRKSLIDMLDDLNIPVERI